MQKLKQLDFENEKNLLSLDLKKQEYERAEKDLNEKIILDLQKQKKDLKDQYLKAQTGNIKKADE